MPLSRQPAESLTPPTSLAWRTLEALERAARRLRRAPAPLPIHRTGQRGEDLAYWALRQRGYTIVARNFRLPGREGEVDLIAWEGRPPALVFIEVKTRSEEGLYPAEDAVDADKRRHLIRLAHAYRRRRAHRGPYRFDVVAIHGPWGAAPRIRLHRGAFRD